MRALVLFGFGLLQLSRDTTPQTMHRATREPECTISDSATDRCSNLMPAYWNPKRPKDYTPEQIDAILTLVRNMPRRPQSRMQVRGANWSCRTNVFNDKSDQFELKYEVPSDVAKFPLGGTSDRALVVAFIAPSSSDVTCWEQHYGVASRSEEWSRQVQFITATTDATRPPDDGPDRDIGKWQVWTIEARPTSNGTAEYRVRKLESGTYRQCGHPHDTTQADVGSLAFISCDDARRMQQAARNKTAILGSPKTFPELLDRYSNGELRNSRELPLRSDPFEAPAWQYCGNLGCCEVEH
jgi:hypothetical protein